MVNGTCPICAGTVTQPERGRRIYCSKPCSAKASRQRITRLCSVDGCGNPHGARGMCYSHYGAWHREANGRVRRDEYFTITCVMCGVEHQSSRREGKYCSDTCKSQHYSLTWRKKSKLPADHPVMLLIAEARKPKPKDKPPRDYSWRTARECPGCACMFTPVYTPNMITCSTRCSRRVHRWRRKAAEVRAPGSFTWSEFMQIARRFDYRCAYCGGRDGQLEPDHVVPLSRGGINSTTNLLPSCHTCNANKCAMLLDEWAEFRARRGQAPLATHWAPEDKRYWHLTQAMLTAAA